MKWILRILILLLVVCAIALAIGFALPAQQTHTRSIPLKQTPETIFTLLADLPNTPSWNPGVKKIDMLPPIDGKEASRQTLNGNTIITVITTESTSPNHLVRTVGDTNGPFSGSWTYDIRATADGSEVSLTEEATIPNPIFRLMCQIFGPTKYLDENLTYLALHFGESPTIK
jgi:hypothetical protein